MFWVSDVILYWSRGRGDRVWRDRGGVVPLKMVLSRKPVINQQRRMMMSVPAGLISALKWRARVDVAEALSLLVWFFSISLSPRDWEESLVEKLDMVKGSLDV